MDIETVWRRLREAEGETFYTARGLPVVCHFVDKENIQPMRDGHGTWVLNKRVFEKALTLIDGSKKEFNHYIIGSSYVYAFLTDTRITGTVGK